MISTSNVTLRVGKKALFEDVKTVASMCDDFVKQLRLFTEKQNIYNIEPRGIQKIILLKE